MFQDLDNLAQQIDAREFNESMRLSGMPAAQVLEEIRYLAEMRFWQYTPTLSARFEDRLFDWLSRSDLELESVETLLRLIPFIQFVDRDDMLALYRSSLTGPIVQWLVEQEQVRFDDPEIDLRASRALNETWICPLTDSMDIGQFLHVNGIAKQKERPAWKVLASFGSDIRLREYIAESGYKRLVLLEDFVGTGTQIAGPLIFAARTLNIPTLVMPMIVSQFAGIKLARIAQRYPLVEYKPMFEVPRAVHILRIPQPDEHPLFGSTRRIITETFQRVARPLPPETEALTKPYGFSKRLGMLVVLYTNCPNNTLPLLWHNSPDWPALFPRVSRT